MTTNVPAPPTLKIKSIAEENLTGKVIVVKTQHLQPQFHALEWRLYRATGGFGCHADARGSAVFAKCLKDGESTRWERHEIEGWISDADASHIVTEKAAA